jgi:hypothetical protein
MDVGGWLRGLGLGRYKEKFRKTRSISMCSPISPTATYKNSASFSAAIDDC